MELGYDKSTAAAAGTYYNPLYNGNISGTMWRSKGDDVRRTYDFEYDNANRLVKANYNQNASGTVWDNSVVNYSL